MNKKHIKIHKLLPFRLFLFNASPQQWQVSSLGLRDAGFFFLCRTKKYYKGFLHRQERVENKLSFSAPSTLLDLEITIPHAPKKLSI